MKVDYCDRWIRAKKVAADPISAVVAQAAHENGTPYTALLEENGRLHCFIDVTKSSFQVEFLDGLLRSYVAYQFQELRPGRVFLKMAVYREFREKTDEVVHTTSYFFREDGHVLVRKRDFVKNETSEGNTSMDVSRNWKPTPTFGHYESIAQVEL